MLQEIGCEYCGKSTIPFDTVSVNLTFDKSKYCNSCARIETSKQHHFFCSTECFFLYMEDVRDGKKELKWK